MAEHKVDVINLKFICSLMGITQRPIAEYLNTPQSEVSRFMADRPFNTLDYDELRKFMEALVALYVNTARFEIDCYDGKPESITVFFS